MSNEYDGNEKKKKYRAKQRGAREPNKYNGDGQLFGSEQEGTVGPTEQEV